MILATSRIILSLNILLLWLILLLRLILLLLMMMMMISVARIPVWLLVRHSIVCHVRIWRGQLTAVPARIVGELRSCRQRVEARNWGREVKAVLLLFGRGEHTQVGTVVHFLSSTSMTQSAVNRNGQMKQLSACMARTCFKESLQLHRKDKVVCFKFLKTFF